MGEIVLLPHNPNRIPPVSARLIHLFASRIITECIFLDDADSSSQCKRIADMEYIVDCYTHRIKYMPNKHMQEHVIDIVLKYSKTMWESFGDISSSCSMVRRAAQQHVYANLVVWTTILG